MRRLITVATLGLTLGFSSISFASDHMDLYTKPIAENEVRNEIKGGTGEKDFTSFYKTPKQVSAETQLVSDQRIDSQYLSVFGVRIVL